MNISELEKMLSVTRSNIRFYEKAGLISPKRKDNNYRDYTETDITELKKILCLRKMGFSVEEIGMLRKGQTDLTEAAENNILRLEKEAKKLKEALALTKSLKNDTCQYSEIDVEQLWNKISSAERNGTAFVDICKDFLNFQILILDHNHFLPLFKDIRKKFGISIAFGICLLMFIIRGLVTKFVWHGSFWEGFFYPFIIFAVVTLILLPIWILGRKSPKAAAVLSNILLTLAIAFLAFIILALAFLIIKSSLA